MHDIFQQRIQFEGDMIAGTRQGSLSILETADLPADFP